MTDVQRLAQSHGELQHFVDITGGPFVQALQN